MLKYATFGIVFSEIPDEITLELGISCCPFKCKGCHSPFLQKDIGENLDYDKLRSFIKENRGITCVLFSGGDSEYKEIEKLCSIIRNDYSNIKTAWYSGREQIPSDLNLELFDYIKIGPYIQELGGLKSPNTNQRLYTIKEGKIKDITNKFWK